MAATMSAAESELSRWPDLATASMRTQWIRSTVAYRSSSAIDGLPPALLEGSGVGSGTGFRCAIGDCSPAWWYGMVLGCGLLKTGRRGEQRAAPAGTLNPAPAGT